jgi:hypothetical protein
MLFPNHPAYAEIRAGMGYQPGAHALLGYAAPAHDLDGYHAGAYALGDFSASMENAALDQGISINDIELLNSLGATDQDLSNLINGNITLTALYAQYGVTIPGGGGVAPTTPASASVTPPPAPSGPPAQVPSGSTLVYTVTWSPGIGNLTVSTSDAISGLQQGLKAHGMSLINGQPKASGLTTYGLQATILDSIGHQYQSDAQSVLDGVMQQVVGNHLQGSNISSITPPGGAAGPGGTPNPNPPTDLTAWFENNAGYIGLGVVALVFGSAMINTLGGRR